MTIKISIITINYNNLIGLKKTVESVLNQSSKDFEYIIIDGGSTDGSSAFIESCKHSFAYYISEPDLGIYNAINKGIKQAIGEFIFILNSGDILKSDEFVIEKILSNLDQKIIYYCPIYLAKNDLIIDKIEYPEKIDMSFMFTNTLCQQAVIYHSSVFKYVSFDENLKYVSDWKMHFELFLKKIKFKYINIPFAIYDFSGLTSQGISKKLANEERLKLQFLKWPMYFIKFYGSNYRVLTKLLKTLVK